MVEVGTTHIGLHIAGGGVHRHHAAAQDALGIEQRVEGRDVEGALAVLQVKDGHGLLGVEVAHDLGVVKSFGLEGTIAV